MMTKPLHALQPKHIRKDVQANMSIVGLAGMKDKYVRVKTGNREYFGFLSDVSLEGKRQTLLQKLSPFIGQEAVVIENNSGHEIAAGWVLDGDDICYKPSPGETYLDLWQPGTIADDKEMKLRSTRVCSADCGRNGMTIKLKV